MFFYNNDAEIKIKLIHDIKFDLYLFDWLLNENNQVLNFKISYQWKRNVYKNYVLYIFLLMVSFIFHYVKKKIYIYFYQLHEHNNKNINLITRYTN